mmetsp:Transcript_20123/g.22277  ORF Transcript_20123/g.22277 Transcript_20123/m.22277 type:complete len:83 (-) Transcript_20123:353-601(-)
MPLLLFAPAPFPDASSLDVLLLRSHHMWMDQLRALPLIPLSDNLNRSPTALPSDRTSDSPSDSPRHYPGSYLSNSTGDSPSK